MDELVRKTNVANSTIVTDFNDGRINTKQRKMTHINSSHGSHKTLRFSCLLALLTFCIIPIHGAADDSGFLRQLDRDIFDAIYDAPPQREPLATVMKGINEFGDSKTMMGLSMLLMAYGDDTSRETGRLMSSTFIGTGIIVFGVKRITRRKRPLEADFGYTSFPSGHAAFAFGMATILGNQYPKWRVPLYVAAGLVGLSRIYLGRHYASDVLVGASIGTITGTVVSRNRLTLLRWEF